MYQWDTTSRQDGILLLYQNKQAEQAGAWKEPIAAKE